MTAAGTSGTTPGAPRLPAPARQVFARVRRDRPSGGLA